MTQQDIVFEVRRLLSDNSITWDSIKMDADHAIIKINSYLGADYPMMSDILQYHLHRYTMKDSEGVDRFIFPVKYIHTVVIPYIASEVLARDEEFTTIYNKYVMDFENGLFDMFQNEYNRVPLAFRQDSDIGVFFTSDNPKHVVHEQRDETLPEFSFKIYYHFNENEYPNSEEFTTDNEKYKYKSNIIVKDSTIQSFINNIYYYQFLGWTEDPLETVSLISPGHIIEEVMHDIHLYAVWKKQCVLTVDNNYHLKPNNDLSSIFDKVRTLIIPEYVNGKYFEYIDTSIKNFNNLTLLVLPNSSVTILSGALNIKTLSSIVFPKYDYLHDRPKVILNSNCIKGTSIISLHIPVSVREIKSSAIMSVPFITCELNSKPIEWENNWTDTNEDNIKWGVINV